MKLRQAIKLCKDAYGVDAKFLERKVKVRHKWQQVKEARRVCLRNKRWLNNKRMPYIPSEQELEKQADITFWIFEELAKELFNKEQTC